MLNKKGPKNVSVKNEYEGLVLFSGVFARIFELLPFFDKISPHLGIPRAAW